MHHALEYLRKPRMHALLKEKKEVAHLNLLPVKMEAAKHRLQRQLPKMQVVLVEHNSGALLTSQRSRVLCLEVLKTSKTICLQILEI
jgi:hypothetical protein